MARPSFVLTILALIFFGASATAEYDLLPTTFITAASMLAFRHDTDNSMNTREGLSYTVVAGHTAGGTATNLGISRSHLTAANGEAHTDNRHSRQTGTALSISLLPIQHSSTSTRQALSSSISNNPVPKRSPNAAPDTWTVSSGDTGEDIASKVSKPFAEISAANPTVIWTLLSIGETLRIPPPTSATSIEATFLTQTTAPNVASTLISQSPSASASRPYTVLPGDTGYIIAAKAGSTFEQISAANAEVAWSALTVGQILSLPPTTETQPPDAATRPMATNTVLSLASASANAGSGISKLVGNLAAKQLDLTNGKTSAPDTYTFYSGDGSVEAGWPPMSDWLSYDALLQNVKPYIGQNCINNAPGNTPIETAQVLDAIINIANETNMDPRFILAVVMQESNGCVRVATTAVSNANPGLMQSYKGKASCDLNGVPLSPCPQSSIHQMIVDGTAARVDGPTLINALNKAQQMDNCEPAQAFYRAARLYNSGMNSLQSGLDLGGVTSGTPCYSSDIANRLVGWVNASTMCFLKRSLSRP
ncbi:hypothetical protein LTS17_007691 [Exophiala oligosperma]